MATALNAAGGTQARSQPAAVATPAPAVARAPTLPPLTAEQIVERQCHARGGLAAWKAVQTMSWERQDGRRWHDLHDGLRKGQAAAKRNGKKCSCRTDSNSAAAEVPIGARFQRQTAVQLYDGVKGWKWRPYLGRDECNPIAPTSYGKPPPNPVLTAI